MMRVDNADVRRILAADVLPMYADGRWQLAADGGSTTVVDPATGSPVARVASATREDVSAAIASAHQAFQAGIWSSLPPDERARALSRFADLLERDAVTVELL